MHKPNFNTSGVVGRLASLLISSAAIIHSNFVLAAELQPNPQAEPVNYTAKPADRQIRSIEYHRFPTYHLVMGIDDVKGRPLLNNADGKQQWVWHHSPDGKGMELVDFRVHEQFKHSGGRSTFDNSQ